MTKVDRRTNHGKELAARLNRETLLKNMPKLYYAEEFGMDRYRVGRTDWFYDTFEIVPRKEFEIVLKIYKALNMPIVNYTHSEDGDWEGEGKEYANSSPAIVDWTVKPLVVTRSTKINVET